MSDNIEEPKGGEPSGLGPSVAERLAFYQRAGGVVTPVITATLAFFMGGLVVLATGHNPFKTYKAVWDGTGLNWFFKFGHYHIDLPFTSHRVFFWWDTNANALAPYNLSQTLLLTTTLILTGLAVSFAFRCGLFNIGGTRSRPAAGVRRLRSFSCAPGRIRSAGSIAQARSVTAATEVMSASQSGGRTASSTPAAVDEQLVGRGVELGEARQVRVEIAGSGIDVCQDGNAAQPEDGTGGGEEGEGRRQDTVARLHAGCRHSEPQGVGSGGAAYGFRGAAVACGGLFEGGNFGSQHEMLAFEDGFYRSQNLRPDLPVFSREIE